jgi:hypothetical protein
MLARLASDAFFYCRFLHYFDGILNVGQKIYGFSVAR